MLIIKRRLANLNIHYIIAFFIYIILTFIHASVFNLNLILNDIITFRRQFQTEPCKYSKVPENILCPLEITHLKYVKQSS